MTVRRPKYDSKSLAERGSGRASQLPRRLGVREKDLAGKVLLEFGCGNGEVTLAARELLRAEAIGVDVEPRWRRGVPKEKHSYFYKLDIVDGDVDFGQVDFVHSYTVFEHVERPIETIHALYGLLRKGGRVYLNFNLYRGASASHLRAYLDFPWIHLIHTEDKIREMMIKMHGIDRGPSWVNKMTYAQYLLHFQKAGFTVDTYWFDRYPMTDDFYEKYKTKLSCYPRYELELNFMHVRLLKN